MKCALNILLMIMQVNVLNLSTDPSTRGLWNWNDYMAELKLDVFLSRHFVCMALSCSLRREVHVPLGVGLPNELNDLSNNN